MNALRQLIQVLLQLFGGSGSTSKASNDPGSKPTASNPVEPKPTTTSGPAEPFPPKTEDPPKTESDPATHEEEPKDPIDTPLQPLPIEIKEVTSSNKNYVVVSGGTVEVRFRKHKKGLYTIGDNQASTFIDANRSLLQDLQMSDSAMRVMFPVSKNEGNLDAINTWDNSFLTFGMFQWTIGSGDAKGELPALLKKIKEREPKAFAKYFGQYGLDVSEDTDAVYGFLTLDGLPVMADSRKEQFRTALWSFRFWHAGQDPRVMAIEVEHAISRLKTFYWKQKYGVGGNPLAQVITSEYGVALILDNHVNRPGYVDNCLRLAVKEAGLDSKAPAVWTSEDERKVIEAYLGIRENYGKYPMTHAAKRGEVTKQFVKEGKLSDERGSFVYDPGAARGFDPMESIGLEPMDYTEAEYEDITHFDLEMESRGLDEPDTAL